MATMFSGCFRPKTRFPVNAGGWRRSPALAVAFGERNRGGKMVEIVEIGSVLVFVDGSGHWSNSVNRPGQLWSTDSRSGGQNSKPTPWLHSWRKTE
jgi:hypothetical protein